MTVGLAVSRSFIPLSRFIVLSDAHLFSTLSTLCLSDNAGCCLVTNAFNSIVFPTFFSFIDPHFDMCEGRSGKRRTECGDEEMAKMKENFEETETALCTLHHKYEEQQVISVEEKEI